MGKSLVIVESPAKAKTINRYLGDDFIVKSSVGHIRDLPTGSSRTPSDPKERAKQAAITRKLSPEEKILHRERKAKLSSLKVWVSTQKTIGKPNTQPFLERKKWLPS